MTNSCNFLFLQKQKKTVLIIIKLPQSVATQNYHLKRGLTKQSLIQIYDSIYENKMQEKITLHVQGYLKGPPYSFSSVFFTGKYSSVSSKAFIISFTELISAFSVHS